MHEKIDELDYRVSKAICRLLENDKYLLQHDVHERSITHCLACYLKVEFHKCDVDCEYNRDCESEDRARTKKIPNNGRSKMRIFPDIILHKRGTNANNLLAIEVKKTKRRDNGKNDRKKLCELIETQKYEHALFLSLKTGPDCVGVKKYEWMCKCHHVLNIPQNFCE